VEKAPDAFRTISEVAADLNVPQHVLRFWESRFSEIKPMKRGGGRRYYRPDDVDLLRGIRHLLYGEGYTIRGVQRILKEQGLRYVQTIWQPGAQSAAQTSEDADFAGEEGDARASERGRGLFGLLPSLIGNANEEQPEAKEDAEDAEEVEEDEDLEDEEDDEDAEDDSDEDEDDDDEEEIDEDEDEEEDDDDEDEEDDEEEKAAPRQQALRPLALKGKPLQPAGAALRAAISADDMRRLESALRELTECRRLLDAAIKQKV
jgi:DNA-binding transcriptional MerR regulator